jgi:hypothetical protein
MGRSLAVTFALALAAPLLLLPATAQVTDRTLPMRFELRRQGPAQDCNGKCSLWISASGAITADTPHDFANFAQGRDLTGATMALDSDGGSVRGAIALGRDIRRLNLDTTVGRTIDLNGAGQQDTTRASLSPHADCESMCAFVLLGGVHRVVPPQARVMVHQIWLGDRRDDPTAATYSAEDLVLVQRDIGRLAQYTIDMGGSVELLDLSLRIPPWESMHVLTPEETRRMGVATQEPAAPAPGAAVAASPPPAITQPMPRATDGVSATRISERQWTVVDRAGVAALARRHPLTIEGDDIGSFDLIVACGTGRDSYDVSYMERRHDGAHAMTPARVRAVSVTVGNVSASLKVISSQRRSGPDELVTFASGPAPAALIDTFAATGSHSILIETRSDGGKSERPITGIRLGNTGAQQNLPRLAATCGKPVGDRASLAAQKTGGFASAR